MSSPGIVDLRKKSPGFEKLVPVRFAPKSPKRQSPLRARKRRARVAIICAAIFILGALLFVVRWASYLPQYNIQSIDVTGATAVSADLVHARVETDLEHRLYPLISSHNIFLFHPHTIEKDLVAYFPRIVSARVSRESFLSTTLQVAVQERQPFALWCGTGNDCYLMDDAGFVFAQASSTITGGSSGYVFSGAIPGSDNASSTSPIGHVYSSGHFPGLLALLQYLGQAGFSPGGAAVSDDRDFTVPLHEGFYLKVSFGEDASAVSKNLKLVLTSDVLNGKEDQLEYIDLRFGNRVYYKLKGQAETQGN